MRTAGLKVFKKLQGGKGSQSRMNTGRFLIDKVRRPPGPCGTGPGELLW